MSLNEEIYGRPTGRTPTPAELRAHYGEQEDIVDLILLNDRYPIERYQGSGAYNQYGVWEYARPGSDPRPRNPNHVEELMEARVPAEVLEQLAAQETTLLARFFGLWKTATDTSET